MITMFERIEPVGRSPAGSKRVGLIRLLAEAVTSLLLVGRGGFEPPKACRQIYSLLPWPLGHRPICRPGMVSADIASHPFDGDSDTVFHAKFDVISEVDAQEVRNAIDQARREVSNRFDFKNTNSTIEQNDMVITLHTVSEDRLLR